MRKLGKIYNAGGVDTGQYSDIVPQTILPRVIEYAKPNLVMRQLAAFRIPASEIRGQDIDIPIQTSGTIDIQTIAQGAEIPLEYQEVTSRNLRPLKYGHSFYVTEEAKEDTPFSVVEMNSRASAEKIAYKEETLISSLLNTAAGNTTSATTNLEIGDIRESRLDLTSNNFKPTDMIISPELEDELLGIDTFVEANKAGVSDPSKGLMGSILGMKVHVASPALNLGSTYDGYIIDRSNAFVIGEKRPLSVKMKEEPDYDRDKFSVSMRTAMQYLHANAISKIELTP